MTTADIIAHLRKGARDSLRVARLASADGKYELALFHCHLAVEKALKAAIMEKTEKPHPKIHELSALAKLVKEEWNAEERDVLEALSSFGVAARYDDPFWAQTQATKQNAERWIDRTDQFLIHLLP